LTKSFDFAVEGVGDVVWQVRSDGSGEFLGEGGVDHPLCIFGEVAGGMSRNSVSSVMGFLRSSSSSLVMRTSLNMVLSRPSPGRRRTENK